MTKKDFIEKIRKSNNFYRRAYKRKCSGIYINNVYFFYDNVKLCFDDDTQGLFIYDRNSNRIIANIFYDAVIIGFDFEYGR